VKRKGRDEEGLALVITLLITAVLVAVISEVVFAVHLNTSATGVYRDSRGAGLMARGGVDLVAEFVERSLKGKDYAYFGPEETSRVLADGENVLELRMEDEQGKFSINSIVYANGEVNTEYYDAFTRLLEASGLEPGLADTVSDWIDLDDVPRPEGAENFDYYGKLTPAYSSKGAALDTVEELLVVKGFTQEEYRRIAPFVTVYTDGMVNINTAPREVIMALSEEITGDLADAVIDYRKETPFRTTGEIRKVSGFETLGFNLQGRITVASSTFRVFSRGYAGEGIREVEAVVRTAEGADILYWRER